MTEKEFIPYKQALALKELGFDERQFAFYEDRLLKVPANNTMYTSNTKMYHKNIISAPLYQQAFRWFREKYKVDSIIQPTYSTKYQYRMFHIEGKTKVQIYGEYMGKEFKTYEEAELACLIKLIEITKTKINE